MIKLRSKGNFNKTYRFLKKQDVPAIKNCLKCMGSWG